MLSARFLYPFTALIVIVAALPPGRNSTTNVTPNVPEAPKGTSQVGWQSIFWGLFALALNAMTQPSILDVEFFNEPSLIYPARSSPFVCAYDALDIFIALFVLVVKRGETLSDAAVSIQARRCGKMGQVQESIYRNYPWASLVLFLGTATQAVKIFAFRGSGMAWAQAAAAMYFGSFIVLGALSFIAASPEVRTEEHEELVDEHYEADQADQADKKNKKDESDQQRQELRACFLAFHGIFACCALYQVFNVNDAIELCKGGNSLLIFVTMLAYSSNYIIKSLIQVLSGFGFAFGMMYLFVIIGLGMRPIFGSYLAQVLMLITIAITPWIFFSHWSHLIPVVFGFINEKLLNWAIQGGAFLFVGYKVLFHLNRFQNWFDLIAFSILNGVVASLYYGFGYDSQGTVKPAWTEKLG